MRLWRTSPELWAKLKPKAQAMRSQSSSGEDRLWQELRRNQIEGKHFRRQHPIDRFIVDFYCGDAKLVIEVDGSIHDDQVEQDAGRQATLEALGFRVLRFTNDEILADLPSVIERITSAVQQTTTPSPSPTSERETEGERL